MEDRQMSDEKMACTVWEILEEFPVDTERF